MIVMPLVKRSLSSTAIVSISVSISALLTGVLPRESRTWGRAKSTWQSSKIAVIPISAFGFSISLSFIVRTLLSSTISCVGMTRDRVETHNSGYQVFP